MLAHCTNDIKVQGHVRNIHVMVTPSLFDSMLKAGVSTHGRKQVHLLLFSFLSLGIIFKSLRQTEIISEYKFSIV